MKINNTHSWVVTGIGIVLALVILSLGWYVINFNAMTGIRGKSMFADILVKDRIFYLPILKDAAPPQITQYFSQSGSS